MTTSPESGSAVAAGATTRSAADVVTLTLRNPKLWVIVALIVGIAAGSQAIGPVVIPIGALAITLLPMIWAIVAGTVVSGQRLKPIPADLQRAATVVMGVAVLVLCARLAFSIGPNIPLLFTAGPALLLQELGHMFGTILLALPLAVLLRMGPATIGATFSIDREGAFAMVSGKYGPDSPQYRGVLSMYVFGTVFGAIVISLVVSLSISMHVFDPLALAMASGVGSGSMMAAAAGVIVAAHPDMQSQVLAVAATSNLITGVLGLYIGVWVSLPLADRFYRLLTRNRDAKLPGTGADSGSGAERLSEEELRATRATAAVLMETSTVKVGMISSLLIIGLAGVIAAMIAAKAFRWEMIAVYAILSLLAGISIGLARVTKGKLPAIITVTTLGVLVSSPISPIASWLAQASATVDVISVITVMLTIAGLSLGKDLPLLRSIGWKIVPVGIVALVASFVLSAIVAEVALGFWH